MCWGPLPPASCFSRCTGFTSCTPYCLLLAPLPLEDHGVSPAGILQGWAAYSFVSCSFHRHAHWLVGGSFWCLVMKDSQAEKTHHWKHPALSSQVAGHTQGLVVWIHGTYASPQPTSHDAFIVLTTPDSLNLSLSPSLPCVPLSVEQALTLHNARKRGARFCLGKGIRGDLQETVC